MEASIRLCGTLRCLTKCTSKRLAFLSQLSCTDENGGFNFLGCVETHMVLDRLPSILRRRSTSAGNDSTEAPATQEKGEKPSSQEENEEEESTGISRPPGWKPLYGTYEKPVYTDDREITDLLSSIDTAADIATVEASVPPLGTNKEHIQLDFETVTEDDGSRFLVIDVHITEFSEWLPEEKGRYEYPEDVLANNGPYYMHLADNLQNILNVPPWGFEFTEYSSDEDHVVYTYERPLYPEPEADDTDAE